MVFYTTVLLMNETYKAITYDMLHTVKKLLGIIVQERCPKCGSDNWFMGRQTLEDFKIYSDGEYMLYNDDYVWIGKHCYDCEYEEC